MLEGEAHQYALDVVHGKLVAGKYTRKACERYLTDLDTAEERGLEFRPKTAQAYITFFQRAIRHTVGEWDGKPFDPLPWQKFILWNLYGWFREDGTRRFNYAYITVARKNGKTTLMAGAALAALFFDQEKAAEVYFAATKKDQAKIGFDEAQRMVTLSPPLRKHLKAGKHDIKAPTLSARCTYLSSERDTLDGLNVHFAGIDEYHAHTTDGVANVLRSGMQARRNPLHFTITTAGFNRESPCFELQKTCKEILDGIKHDDAQFAILYELDDDDDWTDSSTWIKANPSLGTALRSQLLDSQLQQAINLGGSREVEFKTKHLNKWVTASKTWIQDEVWMRNKRDVNLDGLKCWGGLDLASVSDMTALVMCYPQDGGYHVRGHYFLPSDTVHQVLDREPSHIYRTFLELPNVHLTDGNVTDYASIRRKVSGVMNKPEGQVVEESSLMHTYNVQKIAFDRYNSTQIAIDLVDDGVPLVPFGQGFVSMSSPTKQLEVLVRTGKLWHDGDPVLRWALGNVELKMDPAGNIKADKQKSGGKIDPIVAMIMGIGEHMKSPTEDEGYFEIINLS
jgi:phage terminase large subunit-like protein